MCASESASTLLPFLIIWGYPGSKWFYEQLIPGTSDTTMILDPRTNMVVRQLGSCSHHRSEVKSRPPAPQLGPLTCVDRRLIITSTHVKQRLPSPPRGPLRKLSIDMKDLKTLQHRRDFALSTGTTQPINASLSKRAGKQPIYYELNSLSVGFSVFTPFQQYLQQRVQHGEVVLRSRELAETQYPEYERLRREQELRQLREIVAQVAREDRLEGRLTTIILFDTQGRMLTDIATQVDAVLLNTHSRILHAQAHIFSPRPLSKSAFTVQPAKLHSAPT
ncbi:hypothetical protein NMY22_g10130 [Coprinellus aureogranulatus]|nr:hypothetical protein NMY22_g10130 [Coprinellus aureogranulatus]